MVRIRDLAEQGADAPQKVIHFSERWQADLPAAVTPTAAKRHQTGFKPLKSCFFLTPG